MQSSNEIGEEKEEEVICEEMTNLKIYYLESSPRYFLTLTLPTALLIQKTLVTRQLSSEIDRTNEDNKQYNANNDGANIQRKLCPCRPIFPKPPRRY